MAISASIGWEGERFVLDRNRYRLTLATLVSKAESMTIATINLLKLIPAAPLKRVCWLIIG
jgi:hypothetical protein